MCAQLAILSEFAAVVIRLFSDTVLFGVYVC